MACNVTPEHSDLFRYLSLKDVYHKPHSAPLSPGRYIRLIPGPLFPETMYLWEHSLPVDVLPYLIIFHHYTDPYIRTLANKAAIAAGFSALTKE